MSISGTELFLLNDNVDFSAVEVRYTHKLLKGNFAIVPTKQGTCIFALLGKPNAIKKIMTCNALFGLHYIDRDDHALKFDPALYAENSQDWFRNQARVNGFREVKQFITWKT